MATIYNGNGNEITAGLQSHTVCDEAIRTARSIASDRGEDVFLEDAGERLTVHPDGSTDDGWDGDWD